MRPGFTGGEITATALGCGATVATGNVSDIAEAGVNVINPWLP